MMRRLFARVRLHDLSLREMSKAVCANGRQNDGRYLDCLESEEEPPRHYGTRVARQLIYHTYRSSSMTLALGTIAPIDNASAALNQRSANVFVSAAKLLNEPAVEAVGCNPT
jgi:homoserine acetyltransferase